MTVFLRSRYLSRGLLQKINMANGAGWPGGKVAVLIFGSAFSLTGIGLWGFGLYRMQFVPDTPVRTLLIAGFVQHLIGLGIIPQIAKRVWAKKN